MSVDFTNTCCIGECHDCLMNAISWVESHWTGPNDVPSDNEHNPIMSGCDPPINNPGRGHFQIEPGFLEEARKACRVRGGGACCNIPKDAYTILGTPCNGNVACCQAKWELGKLIIECWQRWYSRNPDAGDCCDCEGTGGGIGHGDKECYTCEDFAKMHKEGPCGHRCCDNPPPKKAGGSASTSACNGDTCCRSAGCSESRRYWNMIKSYMQQNCPDCLECTCCSNAEPCPCTNNDDCEGVVKDSSYHGCCADGFCADCVVVQRSTTPRRRPLRPRRRFNRDSQNTFERRIYE